MIIFVVTEFSFMKTTSIQISPSMMCADFLNLRKELDTMIAQKVAMLHIDIMDGRYVPNFTLGTDMAYAMQKYSDIPLDFHLMVDDVDSCYTLFTKHEGNTVTFHPETSKHPVRTIHAIKEHGCKAGLAIDPGMSFKGLKYLLPLADVVCVMTVNPGFSGQKVLPFCLEKTKELLEWRERNHLDFLIQVDGNVSWENIPLMIKGGADILVLGTSSVFNKNQSREDAYQKLKNITNSAL